MPVKSLIVEAGILENAVIVTINIQPTEMLQVHRKQKALLLKANNLQLLSAPKTVVMKRLIVTSTIIAKDEFKSEEIFLSPRLALHFEFSCKSETEIQVIKAKE